MGDLFSGARVSDVRSLTGVKIFLFFDGGVKGCKFNITFVVFFVSVASFLVITLLSKSLASLMVSCHFFSVLSGH